MKRRGAAGDADPKKGGEYLAKRKVCTGSQLAELLAKANLTEEQARALAARFAES